MEFRQMDGNTILHLRPTCSVRNILKLIQVVQDSCTSRCLSVWGLNLQVTPTPFFFSGTGTLSRFFFHSCWSSLCFKISGKLFYILCYNILSILSIFPSLSYLSSLSFFSVQIPCFLWFFSVYLYKDAGYVCIQYCC